MSVLESLTAAGQTWQWQLRDSKGRWIQAGAQVTSMQGGKPVTGIVVGSPKPGMASVKLPNGSVITVPTSALTVSGPPRSSGNGGSGTPSTAVQPDRRTAEKSSASRQAKAVMPPMDAATISESSKYDPEFDRTKGGVTHTSPAKGASSKDSSKSKSSSTGSSSGSGDSTSSTGKGFKNGEGSEKPDDRRLNGAHQTSRSIEALLRERAKAAGVGDPFGEDDKDSKKTKSSTGKGGSEKGSSAKTGSSSDKSTGSKKKTDTRKKLTRAQIDAVNKILSQVMKSVRDGNYGVGLARLDQAEALLKDTSAPWLSKRIHFLQKGMKSMKNIAPVMAAAKAKRRVRTPQGALYYGQPIGTIITADLIERARRSAKGLAKIQALVHNFGGASVKFDSTQPTSGYMAAQLTGGVVIPDNEFFGPRGVRAIRTFMRDNQGKFDSDPDLYLGLWHDEEHGVVTIDISHNIEDRQEAIDYGKRENQRSIWDVVNQEEVDTGGTGGYAEEVAEAGDVRAPDQEGVGDDGRGTGRLGKASLGDGPGASEQEVVIPPVGPNRPAAPISTLSQVPEEYQSFVNNAGTDADPAHTFESQGGLTISVSEAAEHFRQVLEDARNGTAVDQDTMPDDLATSPEWYRNAQRTIKAIQQKYIDGVGVNWDDKPIYDGMSDADIARMKAKAAALTDQQMFGLIAATSPRCTWQANITKAEQILAVYLREPDPDREPSMDWAETAKCGMYDYALDGLTVLTGGPTSVMTGTKRQSFWNNLVDPDNSFDVTVDGWMATAVRFMGKVKNDGSPVDSKITLAWLGHGKGKTVKKVKVSEQKDAGYIILADALRKAAAQLHMKPSEAQALYWVSVGGGQTRKQMWPDETPAAIAADQAAEAAAQAAGAVA